MNKIQRILAAYRSRRVLVIGDFMLDMYLKGHSTRLSPEAPVPVVALTERKATLGAAANVAMNVSALGAQVCFCTVTGDDDDSKKAFQLLAEHQIDASYIVKDATRETVVKTRIVAGEQIVTRYDCGTETPINEQAEALLIANIQNAYQHCDAVLVADYGKGVITGNVLNALCKLKESNPKFVAVDSKRIAYFKPLQPSLIKPNYEETVSLLNLCYQPQNRHEQLSCMGEKLYELTGASLSAVTLDAEGALIFCKDKFEYRTLAQPVQFPNPIGAGDTFISAFALSLVSGAETAQAAELASIAASIGMGKKHTAFCSRDELYAYFTSGEKYISSLQTLAKLCSKYRAQGRKIVFTNGCFDILHSGHVSYLNAAREQGDVLIVGVNNDDSIRRLKGSGRPINPLDDRIAVLSGLASIDHLVAFGNADDDTPVSLIKAIQPHVFVKGGDYTIADLPEAGVVEALGGKIMLLPYIPKRSTTNIISKIRLDKTPSYAATETTAQKMVL